LLTNRAVVVFFEDTVNVVQVVDDTVLSQLSTQLASKLFGMMVVPHVVGQLFLGCMSLEADLK
jgi:hypothetical protein